MIEEADKKFIRYLNPSRPDDMALIPGMVMALHSMGRTLAIDTEYSRLGMIDSLRASSIPMDAGQVLVVK
jgi:hypothetical protein